MSSKKKIIIAICICVVLCVVLVIAAVFQKNTQDTKNGNGINQNGYYDADSGETVLDPDNKSPEGLEGDGAVLLGFSKLLDIGLSSQQLELTTSYMRLYSIQNKIQNQKITQISLIRETSEQLIDQTSGQKDITADIKINRTVTQKMTLSYVGLNDLLLRVSDINGVIIYTSPYDE